MTSETVVRKRKTYCRICEASCGMIAHIDGNGRVVGLKPDRQHPVSGGFACAMGTRFAAVSAHSRRLLHPLKRLDDGSLKEIGWDEAMDMILERLKPILDRYGPHALGLYYGNPSLFNAFGLASVVGFNEGIGTRNVFSSSSVDCNNKFAAADIIHGGYLIQPIPDLEHADLALMLGTNPAVSNSSFVHLKGGGMAFTRLVKRGGEVIWVDPHRSDSAKRWGEHLPIRPGTDVFLLLALLAEFKGQAQESEIEGLDTLMALAAAYPAERVGFTGISRETIQTLAARIRSARATTFHMSVGVNMGPFGTLAVVVLQALAYVSGNFDSCGGLLFHPIGIRGSSLLRKLGIGQNPKPSRVGNLTGVLDELPAAILADEITTPGDERIRAMVVVAGNPLRSIPGEARLRRAFSKLDFTVQIDFFTNQTSDYADLILPTSNWLERWDIALTSSFLQTGSLLQYAGPVQAPPPDVRHERKIFADMGRALERPLFGSALVAKVWGDWPLDTLFHRGMDLFLWPYRLFKKAQGVPIPRPKPGRYLRRKKKNLRFWGPRLNDQPQRLTEFCATLARVEESLAESELGLTLISRRRKVCHNSWLHGARPDGPSQSSAWLCPQDMARLDLDEDNFIQVSSEVDSILIHAVARTEVGPGSIVIPHGLPEANINALYPSGAKHVERVSGNHVMTGLPVVVRAHTRVSQHQHLDPVS